MNSTIPADLKNALKWLERDRGKLCEARDFYEGTVPESFGSYRLARVLGKTSTKHAFNFARGVITAVTDRLEISSITAADDADSAALQVVWDESGMDMEAGDAHEQCAYFGNCYIIVWPDEDNVPQFFLNSPLNVCIVYDTENPRKKKYAIKVWDLDEDTKRADLFYEDRIERYTGAKNGDSWEPFLDEHGDDEGVVVNEYGAIPVFHMRTGRPYGRPMHADAYGPQVSINKILTALIATSEYATFPQRYALSNPVDVGGAMDVELDDEEDLFSAADRTPAPADYSSHPGSMWILRGMSSVGQFPAADAQQFLNPFRSYVQSMAALTSTPLHVFDLSGVQPSGESRRAAESPLVKRVQDLQRSIGSTWKDAAEFALLILGRPTAAVTVNWKDPQSVDDSAAWDVIALKISVGVPFEVAMLEAGYTEDAIAEWEQKQQEAAAAESAKALAAAPPPGTPPPPKAPAGAPLPKAKTNAQEKSMAAINAKVPGVSKYAG